LLGDNDAWRLNRPEESLPFYEGLKMADLSPECGIWPFLLYDGEQQVQNIIERGEQIIRYRDAYCDRILKSYGYETTLDGFPALAVNLFGFGSLGFGDKFAKYKICISYIHDGRKYMVSLYSQFVDVSLVAQNHGGGGHAGAAGFVCDQLPFKR
jgi:hypothetical protein